MATVRELVTKYGFEVNDKPLHELQETLEMVTHKVAGVAASFAVAAGAIFATVAATAHAGDEAKAAAMKIGITTEALGRLQYAAKLSNMSAEGLQNSLKFLSRNSYEAAKNGGDVAEAFRKVGVSLRDGSGKLKSADQLTLQLADKFKKMPDGMEKSALAMKIFGRSGSDMIPFLNEGAEGLKKMGDEAEAFGITFSKAQADLSDEVNDNFDRITEIFKGLTFTIGKELLPMMKNLTEGFIELLNENRTEIINDIRVAFQGLTKYIEFGWKMFKQLVTSAKGFIQLFGGFENIVKVIGAISAVLSGGTLLYAIGAATVAVAGLASAFTLANLAALAIPIGIGLAIVAIGLIIEDIVTFFQGGESYFGDFINMIKEEFPNAFKFLTGVFDMAKVALSGYIAYWKLLYNIISKVVGFIVDMVTPVFNDLIADLTSIGNLIGKVAGFVGGALSGAANFINGAVGPSSSVTNAQQSSIVNNVNAPISVTTGGNMSASQAASSTRAGVGDGLDTLLRGANRSYSGGVAY